MKQAPERFPARLHVLLAREAPLGVVFRRGPSNKVCTFLWDRRKDTFTLGQWLHGRIYERRTDLSPNSEFLIYFAMNGRWNSESRGSWTAVSRAPWLKALAFYPKGDCYEGGGLFVENRRYWINDRYFNPSRVYTESREVIRDQRFAPQPRYGAEDTSVYYPRLQRDGWTLCGYQLGPQLDSFSVFEKPLGRMRTLRKIAHEQVGSPPGKGCYWDEHELVDKSETLSLPDWEWADIDGHRLLWAERGRLFAAPLSRKNPLQHAVLLHDFNAYRFERVKAPY